MRGQSRDHPAFPSIESQLGYNPARFLDSEIEQTGCTTDLTVISLIRGIQEISTIRAWLTVEADLGRGHNGGPRQRVVKWLNRRQAVIKEADRAPSTPTAADTTTTANEQNSTTVDSEPTSDVDSVEPSPSAEASSSSAVTTVATDGGTSSMPRCPDCRGKLTPEEVGDETAHWCVHCGGFRDPIGGTSA